MTQRWVHHRRHLFVAIGLVWLLLPSTLHAQDRVDFSRDVQPILSDHCYQCHGPDGNQREADLRLDLREDLLDDRNGRAPVVPGDAAASELARRVTASDPDVRMPPAEFDRPLNDQQIALLSRWIEQGADWQQHWSFVAPERPPIPEVSDPRWCRNAIDRFVLAKMPQGMTPSGEADESKLLRRLHLDLTGLPPTPNEVDAFLADESPNAYEKVVDRLLSSPGFGEHLAGAWLDAARYADTSGYQNDGPRSMWRWRDWVIDAINQDMPFDQFTVEQLAGDLLPQATLDQQIATAFNRNHRGNAEGGIIAEEYQVEYVVDRVDTTATVWLGLTMGCARCHDHKYDPISQKDFYRVFAYFNNVPEYGRAIKQGNSPPFIKAPTRAQQNRLTELTEQIKIAQCEFGKVQTQLDRELAAWQESPAVSNAEDWYPAESLVAHFALDELPSVPTHNQDDKTSPPANAPTLVGGDAHAITGKLANAVALDGNAFLDAGDVGKFGYFDRFSVSAWVRPKDDRGGTVVSRMTDEPRSDGWYVQIADGHVQMNLVKRWLDDSIRVETEQRLLPGRWYHIVACYDGSRQASGISISIDGSVQPIRTNYDFLNQSFQSTQPLRIGGGNGPDGRFHGSIDEVRVYRTVLPDDEVKSLASSKSIQQIVAATAEARSDADSTKLRQYFVKHHASRSIRRAANTLQTLQLEARKLVDELPTVMVMQEMDRPRETFVLTRGRYDQPDQQVAAGIPSAIGELPQGASNDRLGFARWLIDRENPLTARVTVNRWWQMVFGTGLVRTVEDFGTQGDRPSHPELLDWLAIEWIESGWSTKQLLRTIVTSATYRQTSTVSAKQRRRDPNNRWLARGGRIRMSAAMIRDQALHVGGLLNRTVGGPSVRPYQPEGLWKEIATDTEYERANGGELYRRSLYTYWKRTVAPPNMMVFDASSRESCTVRQTRTTTPLQALALMNDVAFVEAARVLAQRLLGDSIAARDRLRLAFRLATSRQPTPQELTVLESGLQHYLEAYRQNAEGASKLAATGDAPSDQRSDPVEVAAYTAICSLILNLNETITKE